LLTVLPGGLSEYETIEYGHKVWRI
jgi:hypothetical protein